MLTRQEASVKRIFIPLLVLGILSGCETMGVSDNKAAVEDRTAQTAKQTATGEAGTAAKGTSTSGMTGGAVSGQALGTGMDPRKDPASLLSKRSVYFDFDSFVVKDTYRPMIEAHAAYLKGHQNARVVVQGNADERGSREYNLALGQKRAEAVRKLMSVMGVQDSQLEAVSFGEEKPRAHGTTEQDYAENRRADIVYGDE
jgi:peptidoglycan-associated lipoprotein